MISLAISESRFPVGSSARMNFDSLMAREIMDLLDRINAEGTTIVMVTHSPECAVRSQRQIHVLDGRVVDVAMPHISLARTEASAGVASTLG